MIGYLKKNKLLIFLLLGIGVCATLPLLQTVAWADVEWTRKGLVILLNLMTTVVSYSCFYIMFGDWLVGIGGSFLYTLCPLRYGILYGAGDWRLGLAWCFVPIVLLGLVRLYADTPRKSAWMTLSLGLVLLAASSLTFFSMAVCTAMLWFLIMGKQSFCRERLWAVVKTVLATGILGGWFLVKPLLAMRDPAVVGSMIPENFRMSGFYFAQYFSLFPSEGSGMNSVASGAKGAMEMGMGAAILLLVLLYLWCLFVKKFEDSLGKRMLVLAGVLLWLGSNAFPWDLLQNKNMLFSVVLAILQTPVYWAAFAYAALSWVGCRMLQKLRQGEEITLPRLEIALPDRLMVWIVAAVASLPLMVSYNIVGEELLWYLMEAEELLGVSVDGVYPLFAAVVNVATAWIAYVSLGKALRSSTLGTLASALYTLLPYRLTLMYTRSAVAEYLVWMLLPLLVLGVCIVWRKLGGKLRGGKGEKDAKKLPWENREGQSLSMQTVIYLLLILVLIYGTYQVNEILRNSGNLMFL